MPGLTGFTDERCDDRTNMLFDMRNFLKHFGGYIDEELYCGKNIYSTRTHLGLINQGRQPYVCKNRFFSWIEGEFYNQDELKSKYRLISTNDNEFLADIYDKTRSFEFLRDIDGYYAAVLFDKEEEKVFLITDRYGFKPLYWGIIRNNLVWSSELKGFLGHKDFKPLIRKQAVEEFFDFGYLLENNTWFDEVELVPPSAVLTFNLKNQKVEIWHYWSWNDIKPMEGDVDENELIEELGRLFKDAVHKRIHNSEKISIPLSGGLDSRAIMAAVPESYNPLHTFTFGELDCDDIKIATQAARIKRSKQHIFELNSDNWLMPRINGVWKSEGSASLMHQHGIEFLSEVKKYADFFLNGFAGDLVFGGSYLTRDNIDQEINSSIVKKVTNSNKKDYKFLEWYAIHKTDPYFINNRVRRFTNSGLITTSQLIEERIPFFDNKLIDFFYSISDRWRYDSYIYNKMLLKTFPAYFENIPWQKTGHPISISELAKIKLKIKNKMVRGIERFTVKLYKSNGFSDYPNWIRREPARSFFNKLLLSKKALYPAYVNREKIRCYVEDHMAGKVDYHNELCLVLTFELWLNQVLEGKYRDGADLF